MQEALYDLHTHTTASDGRLSPRGLVREAARRSLEVVAITDHDTIEGLDEAREEAALVGLEIVAGVEVSASYDGASVHVLGLFIRHREPWLTEFFSRAQKRRVKRIQRIIEKLATQGVRIDREEVFARSTHGTIGRPHVAEVLVERGVVASQSEAFNRYLGQKAPAYVGYEKVSFREAVALVRRAGGVAALAHPGLLGRDDLIPDMVRQGVQAIEVYHKDHLPETAQRYLEMASQYGLMPAGGSDFHGLEPSEPALGCTELTKGLLENLRQAAF